MKLQKHMGVYYLGYQQSAAVHWLEGGRRTRSHNPGYEDRKQRSRCGCSLFSEAQSPADTEAETDLRYKQSSVREAEEAKSQTKIPLFRRITTHGDSGPAKPLQWC